MAKGKRRRSRSRASGAQASASPPAVTEESTDVTPDRGNGNAERRREPAIRPGGRFAERMRQPSPYPTLRDTLGRAFLAVGASPPILLLSLVLPGALWLGLVASGLEIFPRTLVEAVALPPVSSFYSDVLIPANIFGVTVSAIVITFALTLIRGVIWAVLVGMVLESLEFGRVSMVGVLQGLRAVPAVVTLMAVSILAIITSNLILPGLLGALGLLVFTAVLVGGLYLFPFAPAAAIRGPLRAPDAMRRSARAARFPGSRHVVLVVLYFFVVLVLVAFVPGGSIVTANPSLAEWAWVLGANVVHLVFLAAFCDRWLVVEAQVPTEPPAPRRRPERVRR